MIMDHLLKVMHNGENSIYGKYFDFDALDERLNHIEDIILFLIIVFLVYIWGKLFLYYDKH